LVRIFKSTNEPMPQWYDVHIGYDATHASDALQDADRVLAANGLKQPLVVGETVYDSSGIAEAIKRFLQSSARRIDEVLPWYLRSMRGCQVAPPYTPGAYGRALHAQ
jgi:phosphohistidine phosphatase SixA